MLNFISVAAKDYNFGAHLRFCWLKYKNRVDFCFCIWMLSRVPFRYSQKYPYCVIRSLKTFINLLYQFWILCNIRRRANLLVCMLTDDSFLTYLCSLLTNINTVFFPELIQSVENKKLPDIFLLVTVLFI